MRVLSGLLVVACLAALGTEFFDGSAQGARRWYRSPGRYYGGATRGYGWGGWGNWGRGVSAQESNARGAAEMMRARGEYNQRTAKARIDNETARTKYIENKKLWVQRRLETQKIGREAREEHYAQKREARERAKAFLENEGKRAPRPRTEAALVSTQFDTRTGYIDWPESLQNARFDAERNQISELLVLRAHTGASDDANAQILDATRKMQSTLKRNIRSMAPNEYIEAKGFLQQLSKATAPQAA